MRTSKGLVRVSVVAAVVPLLAVACDGGGGEADVDVTLSDFAVELSPASATSGDVTFVATNEGSMTHEFEIFSVEGDVDPASLPVEDNVADTDGLTLLDEVEDVTPGSEAELTVNLDQGTYAVICNLPGHYAQGMHATLSVE
jgi:uncharacterized cupredoxin-like copper-binding protein